MRIEWSDECPQCGFFLARPDVGRPWCTVCEWNLDAFDPAILPPRGWAWLERAGHRTSMRRCREVVEQVADRRPTRPGWSGERVTLVGLCALLFGIAGAALLAGVTVLLTSRYPVALVGVVLVLAAFALRPRFGRAPRSDERVSRAASPRLWGLIDEVAAAVSTPAPDHLVLDYGRNISLGRVGLRRRTTLRIGVGLWVVLTPQMRVAALAHELGHKINGDPNRGLVVEPALATIDRLAEWTGAELSLGRIFRSDRRGNVLRIAVELLLWTVSRVLLFARLGLAVLGLRGHQSAEYVADAVSADVAGTEAARRLLRRLVFLEATANLIAYGAETDWPTQWRDLIDAFEEQNADLESAYRQYSLRLASLWDAHPPAGARALLLDGAEEREPKVVLSEEASARLDDHLGAYYRQLHALVLGTREFRPPMSRW